jgi:hypothetical protein
LGAPKSKVEAAAARWRAEQKLYLTATRKGLRAQTMEIQGQALTVF